MDFNNNNNSNQNGSPYGNNGNPNQNQNPYGYRYVPPVRKPGSGLANAAIALGIISILTAIMMTIYFPFIFGSLAILFAILSKGRAPKMLQHAKTGLICGIAGLLINIVIFGGSVYYIISNPSVLVESAQIYDQMIEQRYGVPSEEILGDSMENIIEDFIAR